MLSYCIEILRGYGQGSASIRIRSEGRRSRFGVPSSCTFLLPAPLVISCPSTPSFQPNQPVRFPKLLTSHRINKQPSGTSGRLRDSESGNRVRDWEDLSIFHPFLVRLVRKLGAQFPWSKAGREAPRHAVSGELERNALINNFIAPHRPYRAEKYEIRAVKVAHAVKVVAAVEEERKCKTRLYSLACWLLGARRGAACRHIARFSIASIFPLLNASFAASRAEMDTRYVIRAGVV